MSHKSTEASRKYHDRIARQYDSMYEDAFWEFHDRVTWNHLKPLLPKEPGSPVLDLGCGTGKWGFKLLKMGFPTTFVDLSNNMLGTVRDKLEEWKAQPDLQSKAQKATVEQADAIDLRALPTETFVLATGMGDVVSICSDPARCLGEVHRLLKPGGVFVFTVDNLLAALDHFATSGNVESLTSFVKTGRTQWLTNDRSEQFDLQMFTPASATKLAEGRGFEVLSVIGKTIIPARKNKKFFEADDAVETLVTLEAQLAREPTAVARASHLQLAARKK